MHIMTRQQRDDLGIAKLPPKVRNYIAELELQVERMQVRSKAHRTQIRASNVKLELANAKLKLAQLAGQAKAEYNLRGKRMRKAS
jgi:hypothetical protein